ncbi:class I SAM-dependent methyltransferase [Baekduia soli]|uniref:Class I SAM-dependent methyltransferase n=1 Tax=Baekduia soli TaxID=496014 RepID=A0A5B8U548_9ACTN|nr:class I SAM-dependent methyltransferase [Baekduia soli]QEC48246.1 class I SAM-dependent methyltransferase [Baekduia soli]
MTGKDPKKFDPARAHVLDAPERERYLPTDALVALLDLQGDEIVVDYGAGTGRITIPAAHLLRDGGRVVAVDSSDEMLGHLRLRTTGNPNVTALHVADDAVPLPDASVDRVIAVNLLHEVRGERALAEMRRLLKPSGFTLVVDWERGRRRDIGPPDELLYDADGACRALGVVGLRATVAPIDLPYHFALLAIPTT